MKSRDLITKHDVIASNYKISPLKGGKYLHTFTPATTTTIYQFEANSSPIVTNGERYNIAYSVDEFGNNIVDISTMSKTSQVDPIISYMAAKQAALEIHSIEKAKNDQRVKHFASDGYYWGKKYAWRRFGLAISSPAFHSYLEEIKHPSIPCKTQNPDLPYQNEDSIAYRENGLEETIEKLISTAKRVGGPYFKSPLYSKKFQIKGINALTDKK